MAEYSPWWVDRLGTAASATVSPAQREPEYGAALDIATASNITPGQYTDAINAIQTVSGDISAQQAAVAAAQMSPAQRDAITQQAEGQTPEEPPSLWERGLQAASGATGLQAVGSAVSSPVSAAWDALSGVDEETGLNRTERNWLQAQAGQDSHISKQQDVELVPALRSKAAKTLRDGEWDEDLAKAYEQYQGNDWLNRSLEWVEQEVYQPGVARPVSTFFQHGATTEGVTDPDFWSGATWRESWERSEHISPGRALSDAYLADLPDWLKNETQEEFDLDEAYNAGFDEHGQPLDQAYYDLRKDPTYNVISGTTDFTIRWFADPLVVGGKAAGAGRAITKMDWTRMPAHARRRMERIVTAPADRVDQVRSQIPKHDILGQRALKVRDQMYDLRDKIRSDPEKYDPVWMSQNIRAFRDDTLGASLFHEAARQRHTRWASSTGETVEVVDDAGRVVYDNDTWELAVASMFGNGRARAELASKKELDDLFQAATSEKLHSVDMEMKRLESLAERALSTPGLTGVQRQHLLASTAVSLQQQGRRAAELEGKLSQYESYHRFQRTMTDSADTPFLRYGDFRETGRTRRALDRITSTSFRPTKHSTVSATHVRVPLAPWAKRSQMVDLSGHGSIQEQLPRYLDEMTKASVVGGARAIDALTEVAQRHNFGSWDEMRRDLLNQAARARTDVERQVVMRQAEAVGVETVAAKHGMSAEEAVHLGSKIQGKRGEVYREARRQAAEAGEEGVSRFRYADGDDVKLIDLPISLTQLQNYYIPTDLRKLDQFLKRDGADAIRGSLYAAKDVATEAGELFNTFWKPFVLFRFGYPVRTVSEEQFRILAHTGSWSTMLSDLPQAMGTGVVNTGKRVGNLVARNLSSKKQREGSRFQIKTQVERYSKPTVVGQRTFGGSMHMGRGDMYEALNSSGDSMARQHLNTRSSLNEIHSARWNLHKTQEGETGHADAWLHVLNSQVRYDPMRQMILRAGDDPDELAKVANWLRYNPEGREAARRMPFRSHDPERWVEEQAAELATLVPDDVLRAKILSNEEITLDDLKSRVDDPDAVSPVAIDEAALQITFGEGKLADTVNGIVTAGYKALAQIPTDVLARNPFFNKQYKFWLQRQTESLADDYVLDAKQIAAFERQAREFALKQTRRYLFNLGNETDLTHYMRFFAPFMGAWKESMSAWGRIFTENPESFARLGVNGWLSMGDLAFVQMTDLDGRTEEDPLHGDLDIAMVSMPKSALKAVDPIVPGDLSAAADLLSQGRNVQMPIRKQTLNTTLQGDPFWLPGAGPLVQLGGSYAIGDMPWLSDENAFSSFMHKYLFPIGVPDSPWDAVKSTLFRRIERGAEGTESPVFTRSADLLHKTMIHRWEAEGRPGLKPTWQEAEDMAGVLQATYIVGAVGSPFSFGLQPDSQFFVDQANQYRDEHGFEDGYKRYIEDFGEDAYLFWYSNSKNVTGVPPTSPGAKQSKKFRDLIDQYPDIGLALVGLDTRDEPFNYDAYAFQERTGDRVTPGGGEAVVRAESQQGWEEWRKFNNAVDAEMVARGIIDILPSGEEVAGNIQRAGAEDLRVMKRNFREQLREKYRGWSDDYDNVQRNSGYDVVRQFREVISAGKAPDRMEWEGVSQYLDLWEALAAELDARGQAGGSSNIETEANRDLQQIYRKAVADIVMSNVKFADLYHRYLETHTLTNGSNGLLGSA